MKKKHLLFSLKTEKKNPHLGESVGHKLFREKKNDTCAPRPWDEKKIIGVQKKLGKRPFF